MSLSSYQGTAMTIRYAHRKSNPTGLSQIEIKLLRQKCKGNPEKMEELNKKIYGVPKTPVVKKTYQKEKMIKDCQKLNQRFDTKWHSVQERSNQIALQCLGKF